MVEIDDILEFFGRLPNESARSYELDLTAFAMKLTGHQDLLAQILDGDYPERIRYAAFYCNHIILRRIKDFDRLAGLIDSYGPTFDGHKTYDHLVSLYMIESDALYDYEQILAATYKDSIFFDDNAGFVHLFADVFASIFERGGLRSEEEYLEKWYEKALAAVETAIELDASYAKYYCTKARILCIAGRYNEAETNINKAISLEVSTRSDYFIRISNYQYYKALIYFETRLAAKLQAGGAPYDSQDGLGGKSEGEYDSIVPNDEGRYAFVSYSHLDSEEVYPLIKKLQNAGAHFWFDKGGIIASNEYAEVIGERLQNASSVLFMISPNAVTSEFVRKELQMAFDCGKKPICVFLKDTDLSPGMKLQINIYQHILRHTMKEDDFIKAVLRAIGQ